MNKLLRFSAAGVLLLLLGVGTLVAQEVVFTPGPAVTPRSGASNGGFAWADVNGDGTLDVFIPSNNIVLNNLTSFASAVSTKTANIIGDVNSVGGLLADINGDGVLDLWSTNGGKPQSGLFYDSAGVYIPATGTGDLASAGPTGSVFQGMAVADINHSNYLSAAWAYYGRATWADGAVLAPGYRYRAAEGRSIRFHAGRKGSSPRKSRHRYHPCI